ncbi:PAS domain S-box protein [Roseateles saccharophilus]|uniref:PAS domain-containing hybrid sensor histidine kinase/response regulator n=1 Tax=Roseateles saccharophilus TaxID=304 RepID=UPI00286AF5E3|nr:PAS domain S-box protein [Roseateles saccharophilus]
MPTDASDTRDALQMMAARTLLWIVGIVGSIAALVGIGETLMGLRALWGSQRLVVGLALLGVSGVGWLLCRAGRARMATTLVLGGTLLALFMHAAHIGIGVHTVVLAAGALVIALGGGVAGNAAAVLLTLLYLAGIGVLASMEAQGLLQGLTAPRQPQLSDRLVAHFLLATSGLASALLLNRILGTALARAIGEEARLARLVQAAHNWAWEADAKFRVTMLSDEFEALSGHKPEAFLRMGEPGGAMLVRDADYPGLLEDIRAKRAYRDRINGFRAPDGRLLWTLSSGEPVFDASGTHIGWRGVSHNITGERLALQQHQRTASMLDRVLRASPDAICVAQMEDGRIRFANSGFCALVGLSRDELMGRSGRELGLWPDSSEPKRLAAELSASGIVRDFRSALLVHGEWRDVLVSAATLDWEGEQAIMLIARDITERERARIEAEAILEHASVGIALTRGERFERVNHHWQEIFGGTEPQLADGNASLPSAQQVASAALAFERDFIRPDGRRITVRFNARGLPATLAGLSGQDGDRATLWVADDVTERRRQERELRAAKQQAEGASHAKSAFLATMSHEIRTPLNGVLGLARLLQQGDPDDAHRNKYLAHLVGAAESLNEIVSNVLDLSKIEAGHLELEKIEFDLHALAQASFEGCAALGRERGLDMQIELAPGLPRLVIGDPLRVRQIMANFLVNALKFTERGHIRLKLSAADTDRVRIVVADSGIGVPTELQGRLFRPFAQADDSTTRRFGGTGLGLSICRELATRMQGRVGVHSDGASGSSFWAELALPTSLTIDDTAQRRRIPLPPRYPLAGQRLLVAEDNPVNRLIITALLQRLGAEVVEAEDGDEAVRLAREQAGRLDGVLMDLHMPKVDGLKATQILRADPATARLPIHAFTAAVLDQERQAALTAGMNGFIAKPVAEEEVIRVLGRQP